MPDVSKAIVFNGSDKPLECQPFALPQLKAGELLIKVRCSTLCGSDVHTFEGRRSTPCPTILGHEILGEVVELPPGGLSDASGDALQPGDRVTWAVAANCGDCFYCRSGLPQKCTSLFKYGHEQIREGHALSGGLAEYCHLAVGTCVLKVPPELPDEVACPVNCATATIAAALRYAGEVAGCAVLIQGAGMLGLTAAAMARSQGANEIIVTDTDEKRLLVATRFGATSTCLVESQSDTIRNEVMNRTDGRGVDIAIELSGSTAAIDAGMQLLRIGGNYIWVGSVFPSPPASLSPEFIVRRLIRIQGVHNYAPQDLSAALNFLKHEHQHYPFRELVAATYPLEETEAAFAYAIKNRPLRVAVCP